MNVVVMIEGREAIPVRAIPMLTNWELMFPDAVIDALSGSRFFPDFKNLSAYSFQENTVTVIRPSWWENLAKPKIKALQSRLNAAENAGKLTNDEAYYCWQQESIACLPAGVFVWKDEYERAYFTKYGLEENDNFDKQDVEANEEFITLGYTITMPEFEKQRFFVEGFETVAAQTASDITSLPISQPFALQMVSVAMPQEVESSDNCQKIPSDNARLLQTTVEHNASFRPSVPAKEKRRSVLDITLPYIVQILQAEQIVHAKDLYKALMEKAGEDSPFETGTGNYRGCLYIRENSKIVALKTIQNNMPRYRVAAQR